VRLGPLLGTVDLQDSMHTFIRLDSWVGIAPNALRACGAPAAPAAVGGAQRGAQAGRMEPVAEYMAG